MGQVVVPSSTLFLFFLLVTTTLADQKESYKRTMDALRLSDFHK
jgi:hypothetical protein